MRQWAITCYVYVISKKIPKNEEKKITTTLESKPDLLKLDRGLEEAVKKSPENKTPAEGWRK